MNIIFAMIPLALVLVAVAVGFFFWAVGNDQFDDLDTPGTMILFEDENVPRPMEGEPRE